MEKIIFKTFKGFKEACRKTSLINTMTGKTTNVVMLFYVDYDLHALAGKTFQTNSIKTAYDQYKTILSIV